jgi:drug/metabolite transporter (DMT)-like permease
MTAAELGLVLLSQVCLVAGQLALKAGMSRTHDKPRPVRRIAAFLALGIALLTAWFFLWLGLLGRFELSLLYPFQGLSPVLAVLAAIVFLRERPTWQAGVGVALITAGTVLVGLSA